MSYHNDNPERKMQAPEEVVQVCRKVSDRNCVLTHSSPFSPMNWLPKTIFALSNSSIIALRIRRKRKFSALNTFASLPWLKTVLQASTSLLVVFKVHASSAIGGHDIGDTVKAFHLFPLLPLRCMNRIYYCSFPVHPNESFIHTS